MRIRFVYGTNKAELHRFKSDNEILFYIYNIKHFGFGYKKRKIYRHDKNTKINSPKDIYVFTSYRFSLKHIKHSPLGFFSSNAFKFSDTYEYKSIKD